MWWEEWGGWDGRREEEGGRLLAGNFIEEGGAAALAEGLKHTPLLATAVSRAELWRGIYSS